MWTFLLILVAVLDCEAVQVTKIEPAFESPLCPQSQAIVYCTTVGDELLWRMDNSDLYTFNSQTEDFQQGRFSTYSVLLMNNNGMRRSALTFIQVPENTFSVTCFNGSTTESGSLTVTVSSTPPAPSGLNVNESSIIYLNVSWDKSEYADHYVVTCGDYTATTNDLFLIISRDVCLGSVTNDFVTVSVVVVSVCAQNSNPSTQQIQRGLETMPTACPTDATSTSSAGITTTPLTHDVCLPIGTALISVGAVWCLIDLAVMIFLIWVYFKCIKQKTYERKPVSAQVQSCNEGAIGLDQVVNLKDFKIFPDSPDSPD